QQEVGPGQAGWFPLSSTVFIEEPRLLVRRGSLHAGLDELDQRKGGYSPRDETVLTMRSSAKIGSRSAPLTAASVSASSRMHRPGPASDHPCRPRWARPTGQGASPSWPANCPEPPRRPTSLAMVRSFMANAATIGTVSAPDARACLSRIRASPWRPAMALSATLNALVSTRPE